jgi:hypothetical protein
MKATATKRAVRPMATCLLFAELVATGLVDVAGAGAVVAPDADTEAVFEAAKAGALVIVALIKTLLATMLND